jgi:O-antigen/teichoic acid export membrane protein
MFSLCTFSKASFVFSDCSSSRVIRFKDVSNSDLLRIAVLITVIILLFVGIAIEIVAIAAAAGLALVWIAGWGRGEKLYRRFYDEELLRLKRELKRVVKEAVEETVEEEVQKGLRERFK